MVKKILLVGGVLSLLSVNMITSGGCNVDLTEALLDSGDLSYQDGRDESEDEEVPTDDKLIISGSGQNINVEYNTLVFPGLLNYDSGLYYFAPDPEGNITGDRIVCAAVVDVEQVEGDCFRQGHVCHFNYLSEQQNTKDGKDIYRLGSTSCRRGGEVGPFLVPLESPMCGQDPFPKCPTDDSLFPTGPVNEPETPETSPSQETPAST